MYRRAIACASVIFCNLLVACGAETDPSPDVTVSCNKTLDTYINCNGDVEAPNENEDHGDGGAGGGGEPSVKPPPYCQGFAPYYEDLSCFDHKDCPAPINPCEIPVCTAAQKCGIVLAEPGKRHCGDDTICMGALCCEL